MFGSFNDRFFLFDWLKAELVFIWKYRVDSTYLEKFDVSDWFVKTVVF